MPARSFLVADLTLKDLSLALLTFGSAASALAFAAVDFGGRDKELIEPLVSMSLGMWLVTLLCAYTCLEKLNLTRSRGSALRYGALWCIVVSTVTLAGSAGWMLLSCSADMGTASLLIASVLTLWFGKMSRDAYADAP